VRPSPTMAALLTPLAPGAIAVVGIAGPGVDAILRQMLRTRGRDEPPALPPATPKLCRVVDGGEVIDEAIVVRLDGAVAAAELNLHGGVRIVQRVLVCLERLGAEIVDGRAYLDAAFPRDPIVGDVDAALLRAGSRTMALWLLAQRDVLPPFLRRLDSATPDDRAAYAGRTLIAIRLVRGLSIALVGAPNVGKSTLANRLIGADRVITSEVAGTTRDWVRESAVVGGWPVTLTDTAGLRDSDCALETEAIRRGAEQAAGADLILYLMDGGCPLAAQFIAMRGFRDGAGAMRDVIGVVNKSDLGPAVDSARGERRLVRVSALTGAGIDALEASVVAALGLDRLRDDLPTGFLPRHLPADGPA